MKNKKNKHFRISPFFLVLISFVVVILIGTILLMTPIANSNNSWNTSFIDCLFNATSATCVTGLSTFKNGPVNDLTFFGQLVLLICIKIGGLGFVTIFAFLITFFRKKISFKDKLSLSQAVGSSTIADLKYFVRHIILISAVFEVSSMILYFPVIYFYLYPGDISTSIWTSIFHSISSYNNAGFDIFSSSSLILKEGSILNNLPLWAYHYLLTITMAQIIGGGLSFLVIIDIFKKKRFSTLKAMSKVIILSTIGLVVIGTLSFYFIEGFKETNSMDIFHALFQSVTLRTAGYVSYNQSNLSTASIVIGCFLMFIGGAPLGTAGGIKITTVFIIVLAIISYFRGTNVYIFKRKFSQKMVIKAMAITFLAFFIIVIGFASCSIFESKNPLVNDSLSLLYEVFSAFGTVGITRGITTSLSIGSKIVLTIIMFFGRLGPITIFQIFQKNMGKEEDRNYQLIDEEITIG